MTRLTWPAFAVALLIFDGGLTAAPAVQRGAIKGHVGLSGKVPGNAVIRMGMDPKCAQLNPARRTVQETVAASADGSLANDFVWLKGSFAPTPVPTEPVTLDQQACIYTPRVVGVRVGQRLQVRNSDDLFHNVHSFSDHNNGFNFGQPKAGMMRELRPKDEEIMLRVKCDVHGWMRAFVGVVSHPYFDVTDRAGMFAIDNVPVGTFTISSWQEQYGVLSKTVHVTAGKTTTIDFTYTGSEKAN